MRLSRRARISIYAAAGACLALTGIAGVLALRFQPIARDYFVSKLHERYQSEVELGKLDISLIPTVRATGDHLVLHLNGRRDVPPLVRIQRFSLESGFVAFFRNPKHIHRLQLEGLRIQLPPRSNREGPQGAPREPASKPSQGSTVAFVLDEVIANGTVLQIAPADPDKNPLVFNISHLVLHTVGLGEPMRFDAELQNVKPPGAIHSEGRFGPWNAIQPGDTRLAGTYTFRNADLSVFKGITGTLSSDGKYSGQLDRIEVQGTTDVPNFALTTGQHPMPLHTSFQATVDGTNGDTVLHPVRARLGQSDFEVSGAIERTSEQKRKTITLTTKSGAARLEDFLRLSVKGAQPPMTGAISFDAQVKIPPGKADVMDRLQLDGKFALSHVRFTSQDVQAKIASLSHHAQGDPENHDPNVDAAFGGRFHLLNAQLALPDLVLNVPGATANLRGTYGIRTGALDFTGTAKLQATVSQMTTGVKSLLLRPLDRLFRRDGAGTVVPIVIRGTRGEPSFILDIGRILNRD